MMSCGMSSGKPRRFPMRRVCTAWASRWSGMPKGGSFSPRVHRRRLHQSMGRRRIRPEIRNLRLITRVNRQLRADPLIREG